MRRLAGLFVLLAAATPAWAKDEPTFCPTRPSLGSSACITDPGHVHFEFSTLDWQLNDNRDQREDRLIAGDLLARVGVARTTEFQIGWTAFGHVRTRDKVTGAIDSTDGTGDVTLALRQNLRNPDGKGLSFGIQPYVTLPVGHEPIGDKTWSAGAVLPITYDVSDTVNIAFTGEIDAAADQDDHRRHLAYSGIWGVQYALSKKLSAVAELSLQRDNDPSGHQTQALAAGSVAWQPRDRLQFDVQAVAGLNRNSPDVRLVTGGAILF